MIVSSVKSSPSTETLSRTELQLGGVWRVVVLNDPVNLMSYVMMIFKVDK
jgi:ATP-dependent Clp protease adaptor protein ClpS